MTTPTPIPHPCPHPDCDGTIKIIADPGEIFEHSCPCGSCWLSIVRWLDGDVTVKRIPKPGYE